MSKRGFWHSDDDSSVLAEFMAEHGIGYDFDPEHRTFTVAFGDVERLPEGVEPDSMCAFCNTPVRKIEGAGWRHCLGFGARAGCTEVWPR